MSPTTPAFLAIGRIGAAHGVHGEVRVEVLTDFPDVRFAPGVEVLIGRQDDPGPRPATVERVRPDRGRLLVTFDVASDRTAGQGLSGRYVFIRTEAAAELEPDSYFPHQLIGLEVVTGDGASIGTVAELLETGSADVLVVRGTDGEALIPMIDDVIDDVDVEGGRLLITPLPGLLD